MQVQNDLPQLNHRRLLHPIGHLGSPQNRGNTQCSHVCEHKNLRSWMCLIRALKSPYCAIAATIFLVPALASANVVGTDMQNFNATTSGLDFVTVQSSKTLRPGIFNLGFFINHAINTLPYYEDSSPQGRTSFNDTVTGADLNAGVGLLRNWDIGISLPQVVYQSVRDQNGARGEFAQTGATEIRLNSKYRIMGNDAGGVALVASLGLNRIEDNPWVGKNGGPSYSFEAVVDRSFGPWAVGLNAGYRMRNPGSQLPNFPLVRPLGNQWIASVGTAYHVARYNTKVISELFGSLPAESGTSNNERSLSSLEILAGVKHDITDNLSVHAGASTGLYRGIASPDWRVYSGLNYSFGPLWGANDLSDPPTPENRYLVQVEDPDDTRVLQSPSNIERFRTQKILFEFDSERMIGNYAAVLDELAEHIKAGGFKELVVEGHTDSIGNSAYNANLSWRRAQAIKKYLVSRHRISDGKIQPIGLGETRPIASNANYQGRQQNRRVEFVIKR